MNLVTKINLNNKILLNGGIFIQILIWGQDPRFVILEKELKKKYVVDRSNNLDEASKYDMIILPMKGISKELVLKLKDTKKNCIIYTGLKKNLENINREVISFLDDEVIKDENDNITVDGIIDYIQNIKHDNICLLGYGNIGKKLYQKLEKNIKSIGIIDSKDEIKDITFYTDDNKIMQEKLNNCDLIINTVPNNIIKESTAYNLKTSILDIASSPYGVSREIIDKYKLNYYLYSGIPGKYDPERAGKILLKKIK